jgi:membrane associated rhomboid family serine protease
VYVCAAVIQEISQNAVSPTVGALLVVLPVLAAAWVLLQVELIMLLEDLAVTLTAAVILAVWHLCNVTQMVLVAKHLISQDQQACFPVMVQC